MRFNEFVNSIKTPEQLRVDALKSAKNKAVKALADERQKQKLAKAQKNLLVARAPKPPAS
jgi:hypothetical protein